MNIKRRLKRLLALCAAAAMLAGEAANAADSYAMGTILRTTETAVNQQTQLSKTVFWSSYFDDFREENYITYTPSSTVRPMVSYGGVLTDVSTLTTAARHLESEGERVVAGINGGFYNFDTGMPVGLMVTEGVLRSTPGGMPALGFKANGTAVIGTPKFTITADLGYAVERTEVIRNIAGVNKYREDDGVYLYTRDFNSRHTTGTTQPGVDAVCTVVEGKLSIGGTVKLRLNRIIEATTATVIGENQMVLSVNGASNDYYLRGLRNMPAGATVTITVTPDDASWNGVTEGLGALDMLVRNGREVSGLDAATRAPRTAVGQKRDGTLIFYTMDGRISGHSIGATMAQAAERLVELGCVTAIALDGGGSTTLTVTPPDATQARTINTPSERTERRVSTKIFLLADGSPTGELDHFYLKTDNAWVLGGSRVHVDVSAVDTHYMPMQHNYTLSASTGTLEGQELLTPKYTRDVTLTASGGGKSGSTVVHVIGAPDSLRILNADGTRVTSLSVSPGTQIQLSATAMYQHLPLHAEPACFSWSASGGMGDITESGLFSAYTPGKGSIAVSAGDFGVSIPVTVTPVGMEEIEGFEELPAGIGSNAELSLDVGGELVRWGQASARLDYDLSTQRTASWRFGAPQTYGVPYTGVTLWVNGDGSGNLLSLLYRTASGQEASIEIATLDFTGWREFSVSLGRGNVTPLGFQLELPNSVGLLPGPVPEAEAVPDTAPDAPETPDTTETPDSTETPDTTATPDGFDSGLDDWISRVTDDTEDAEPVGVTEPDDGTESGGDTESAPETVDMLWTATETPADIVVDYAAREEDAPSPAAEQAEAPSGADDIGERLPWRSHIGIDQLVATYNNIIDGTPPSVQVTLDEAAWQVHANVLDGVDGILPKRFVTVTLDGKAVNFDYNEADGFVSVDLPPIGVSAAPSRVTVTARDASGWIGRASVDLPAYNWEHRFRDIDGYWAADYIDWLGANGIAEPYADGAYRPTQSITRLEFAIMLYRASGLDGSKYWTLQLPYADLASVPYTAYPALRALYALNIMRGTEGADGKLYLRPNEGLTRAQASAMIGRAQAMGYGQAELPFPDASAIPAYAADHIRTMVKRGILQGYADGYFHPGYEISRGQMAKILYFLA